MKLKKSSNLQLVPRKSYVRLPVFRREMRSHYGKINRLDTTGFVKKARNLILNDAFVH